MAKKKWKKRLKKLAKAALIGGALYGGAKLLGRGKGAVTGVVNPNAPKKNWITKKAPAAVADVVSKITDVPRGPHGAGLKQKMHERIADQKYETGEHYTPDLSPYTPRVHKRFQNMKGGGIAKRGTGVALKHGGRTGKQFGGGLGSTARRDMRSGYYPDDMGMRGGRMYNKGGRAFKKGRKAKSKK